MILLLGVTAAKVFSVIGYLIVALLTLMVMVVIHEFGHYIVGKILKFKINEFAIGFGPPIFRFMMRSGEYFSIRPIPLGGFCAFEGEDSDSAVEGLLDRSDRGGVVVDLRLENGDRRIRVCECRVKILLSEGG